MSVFISHASADDELAIFIYNRLQSVHGIECYIDDADKTIKNHRGRSSITRLLVEKLRECDTLLAVVTPNTQSSWWVPFEIGTAREIPQRISSFIRLNNLPEYLLEWPLLWDENGIDIFAAEYKKQNRTVRGFSSSNSQQIFTEARSFEMALMKRLGQIHG